MLVHSDTAGVARLGLSPSEFIDTLLEIVGPEGTLVMPSHPVLRERDGRLFYDVQKSPSSVGLVTELFRRRTGVRRSAFPYSAAAATGPLADAVIGSHAQSTRPHDGLSPYAKLAQLDGRVLCVGCALDRMTILHVAEDELPPNHQIPGFYDSVSVTVKSGENLRVVDAEVRAPWLWWYLHLTRWNQEMLRNKLAIQIAGTPTSCYVAEARKIVDWMRSDFQQKKGLYPLAKLNRWLRLGEPAFAKAE
ncbi:MAG: AAC(3) family N-acetyltransferase [Rhizobiales bacterium]|nr:AAC(3) family N-acetyltransferase [Hyphomicrobiales bacterium]